MITEKSMYMIKPEGLDYRYAIREAISEAGLTIVRSKELVSCNSLIETLYSDVPPYVLKAKMELFKDKKVEIGLVIGEYAVKSLFDITGHYADPSLCEKDTIRARFGVYDLATVNGIGIYRNAIHRPKNAAEAQDHTAIL